MKYLYIAAMLLVSTITFAQSVGVNNPTPDPSAALDVVSTTKGVLVPRLTAAQRALIANPATGLLVYQTDEPSGFYFYANATWTLLGATGPQGTKGDKGDQGLQGLKGDKGDTGANGVAGEKGDKGDQGLQGLKGDKGDTGANGVAGEKGDKGDQGLQGLKGDKGDAGTNGQGVPTGGTSGQILSKVDATDYNTQWITPAAGGGSSELQKITENTKSGYRILGRNPENYGDIGTDAIDLSLSNGVSTTRGATGDYSTALGFGTTASGTVSTAMGQLTTASGSFSTSMGNNTTASGTSATATGSVTTASGDASFSMGLSTTASGRYSVAMGQNVTAKSIGEVAVGNFNTDYTLGLSGNVFFQPADRAFGVGIGSDNANRKDGLIVYKDGTLAFNKLTAAPATTTDRFYVLNNKLHYNGAEVGGGGATGGSDNLGNHTATQSLNMNSNAITNATNITATGTATLGGNTYPTNTGTNGQVLQTNGAGALSWGSASGGGSSLQLVVTKTVAQTTQVASSLTLAADVVNFESANGIGAALTGGNTWTNNNTFTVGATGAGTYLIQVQLMGGSNLVPPMPMIEMNNTGNGGSNFYGTSVTNNNAQTPHKYRGQLTSVVYMTAGEFFKIRALSASNVIGADFTTNGSTKVTVVKLN